MIERTSSGDVELTTIHYRDETGPFYYVVIDGTPVLPEMPLPWDEAQRKAEWERDEDPDVCVEVVACTDEDLKWAGVR
ncbi:hypothetical protein BJF79_15485 [Actinomadura sp. CNU-125]|uniref:hypothetical protein n=1 Tax=Actinomadura sp. CNU-125 TaxID=1904961 RepID=UPI0009655355|nr:hypothetical protein [Actinomadura sp. CNU-125]OLT21667.1 hypothetical protein BJF79_15485 [Actinomadura sp. CNU-125]